ncbi:hypothetical protein ACFWBN_26065 [Streptomyces sp. NPDC059989]|uniref:hypothetical protein n=1 Tax=Streptomyces sp. NPDC059989 TaxID=3347026 RepID=UPI0036BE0488
MSYDVHARSKRRILRLGMALTSAAFVSGAVALPASAATGPPPRSPVASVRADDSNHEPGSNTCKPGYVWRDSFEGDDACVSVAERDLEAELNPNRAPGTNRCKPGFVWRDSFEGDALCVYPDQREAEGRQGPNRQPGGGAWGPLTCKPGYVWRDSYVGDALCVIPEERDLLKSWKKK